MKHKIFSKLKASNAIILNSDDILVDVLKNTKVSCALNFDDKFQVKYTLSMDGIDIRVIG